MRVYIVSCVYPPEAVTSASTARDLAEEMTLRGHEVTVFAPFPNRPTGQLAAGYKRSLQHIHSQNGYTIRYSWHTLSKHSSLTSRLVENLSFGLTSTWQLSRMPAPDIVFMNNWPIFSQWMNLQVLKRRRVPIVCTVKDLYPETITNTSRLSDTHPLCKLMHKMSAEIYGQSRVIAPLNSVMGTHIASTRNIPIEKIHIVSDWVDASQFPEQQLRYGAFRTKWGIKPDQFLAMYVGSMTRLAGLELYVETAEQLRHRPDIRLLLVGDGAMREQIETSIRQKNLDNISIIYPLQPEEVPEVQAAADTLMLSLQPGGAEHATPSKLIFYMFSQRPILASVNLNSSPAQIIQNSNCGYVIPQGDPIALASQLEYMADHQSALTQLGNHARKYAEEHFLKDNGLPRLCNLLEQIADSETRPHNLPAFTTIS